MKTITNISDDVIEVVEEVTTSETKTTQYNKNVLENEKNNLQNRIDEINLLLAKFKSVKVVDGK